MFWVHSIWCEIYIFVSWIRFTFSFGQIGLGINFIGLIFLVWYLKLKNEETDKPRWVDISKVIFDHVYFKKAIGIKISLTKKLGSYFLKSQTGKLNFNQNLYCRLQSATEQGRVI